MPLKVQIKIEIKIAFLGPLECIPYTLCLLSYIYRIHVCRENSADAFGTKCTKTI